MRTALVWVIACGAACGDGGAGDGGSGETTGAATSGTPTDPGETSETDPGVPTGECRLLAQDWTVEVVAVDGDPYDVRLDLVAGEPAVAWVSKGQFGAEMMYSARSGGTWSHEKVRASTNLGVPGLAHDGDGAPHLLYGFDNALGGAVELSARRDGAWTMVPFTTDRLSDICSLARAPDGVHGLFRSLYPLYEAVPADAGWTQEFVDDGDRGGGMASAGIGNDLRVADDDVLHASYIDATHAVNVARKTPDGWQRRTVAPDDADFEATAIALDPSGGVHVAYTRESDHVLMLATPQGDAWSVEAIDSGGANAHAAQLEIDGAGVRHLAVAHGGLDVRHADDADGAFAWATVASEVTTASTSLILDADGRPWLVWGVDTNLCVAFRG